MTVSEKQTKQLIHALFGKRQILKIIAEECVCRGIHGVYEELRKNQERALSFRADFTRRSRSKVQERDLHCKDGYQ